MRWTCFAGLDLSSTTDFTAFVQLFPPQNDCDLWQVLPHLFLPAADIKKRERADRAPYRQWAKEGYIQVMDGARIDHRVILEKILELAEEYDIQEIGFDPWNAIQLANRLEEEGFTPVQMRQGPQTMSAPTKELLALIKDKKIAHGGHPALRWMVRHMSVRRDGNGNPVPSKKTATYRIDGVVALIMALGRAMSQMEKPEEVSVLEERDVLIL